MGQKKETLGKIATTLSQKSPDNTHSAHDQMLEQLSEYDTNIYECVDRYKKEFKGNFYIVVLTKKERLLQNVIRNYFFARLSCPTPDYDQAVYRYNKADGTIDFLWVLPAKDVCEFIKINALVIDPEETLLRDFVVDFYDGNLLKICKKLNAETENTGQLILH